MYEKVVYIGLASQVRALDFEFNKHEALAVPPSIAKKLLRSPEFVLESEYLATKQPAADELDKLSDAPETEQIAATMVSGPVVEQH